MILQLIEVINQIIIEQRIVKNVGTNLKENIEKTDEEKKTENIEQN